MAWVTVDDIENGEATATVEAIENMIFHGHLSQDKVRQALKTAASRNAIQVPDKINKIKGDELGKYYDNLCNARKKRWLQILVHFALSFPFLLKWVVAPLLNSVIGLFSAASAKVTALAFGSFLGKGIIASWLSTAFIANLAPISLALLGFFLIIRPIIKSTLFCKYIKAPIYHGLKRINKHIPGPVKGLAFLGILAVFTFFMLPILITFTAAQVAIVSASAGAAVLGAAHTVIGALGMTSILAPIFSMSMFALVGVLAGIGVGIMLFGLAFVMPQDSLRTPPAPPAAADEGGAQAADENYDDNLDNDNVPQVAPQQLRQQAAPAAVEYGGGAPVMMAGNHVPAAPQQAPAVAYNPQNMPSYAGGLTSSEIAAYHKVQATLQLQGAAREQNAPALPAGQFAAPNRH